MLEIVSPVYQPIILTELLNVIYHFKRKSDWQTIYS